MSMMMASLLPEFWTNCILLAEVPSLNLKSVKPEKMAELLNLIAVLPLM